jgi:pyrroloquinoline quinone (PQQ) biosynthesis protein C
VEFSTRFVEANDRVYHLPKEALEWFYEHIEADKGHSNLGEQLVLEYALTKDVQNRVWDSVTRSKSIYWVFFDGLYQAYVLADGASHPHYQPGRHLPLRFPFSYL